MTAIVSTKLYRGYLIFCDGNVFDTETSTSPIKTDLTKIFRFAPNAVFGAAGAISLDNVIMFQQALQDRYKTGFIDIYEDLSFLDTSLNKAFGSQYVEIMIVTDRQVLKMNNRKKYLIDHKAIFSLTPIDEGMEVIIKKSNKKQKNPLASIKEAVKNTLSVYEELHKESEHIGGVIKAFYIKDDTSLEYLGEVGKIE